MSTTAADYPADPYSSHPRGYGTIPNKQYDAGDTSASLVPPEVMRILHTAQSISIRHHVKLLPKTFFSCPPCAKQENTFSVYAAVDGGASSDQYPTPVGLVEEEFLRIDEVSGDWSRTCCSPYHPLKLEVRAYIPVPGERRLRGDSSDRDNSEAGRIGADLARDWEGFGLTQRVTTMRQMYEQEPALFSLVRHGGMRCGAPPPWKCLNCCVCCACCQDGMDVYAGAVVDGVGGRHENWPVDRLVGSVTQPIFGGWCFPRLDLRTHDNIGDSIGGEGRQFSKVEGPCLFGGWSEMCFGFQFLVSSTNSPAHNGDLAVITKQRPSSVSGALALLTADGNNYSISFRESSLGASEKLTVLTAQLLLDYMLFDGNTEEYSTSSAGTHCYLCYCSVLGCLVPFSLFWPSGDDPSHHNRHG